MFALNNGSLFDLEKKQLSHILSRISKMISVLYLVHT